MNAPPLRSCFLVAALAATGVGAGGCLTAPEQRAAVRDAATDPFTVGTVQKEIHLGMSGADVAVVLGAPNIVSTDEQRREVWIYDKIASEVIQSTGGFTLVPFLSGAGGSMAGAAMGGLSQSASATSRTDRTLTVIVKFDDQKKVRDFAYHASQF